MATFDTIKKDTLESIRDVLRRDTDLMVTILGLSGTTAANNHVFVKRPKSEKVNSDGVPIFKLPRILVDLVSSSRSQMGGNLDGTKEFNIDTQISVWTDENGSWDLSLKTTDRIEKILEEDNMAVTNGWAKNRVLNSDDIKDPDRPQTRMGTIRVRTTPIGGI